MVDGFKVYSLHDNRKQCSVLQNFFQYNDWIILLGINTAEASFYISTTYFDTVLINIAYYLVIPIKHELKNYERLRSSYEKFIKIYSRKFDSIKANRYFYLSRLGNDIVNICN